MHCRWRAWVEHPTSCACLLSLLIQIARFLLVAMVQTVGHWLCGDEAKPSPTWFLLLSSHLPAAVLDTCHREHFSRWLETTCEAFLAYIDTPDDDLLHAHSVAASSRSVYGSAARANITFTQDRLPNLLRHVVAPSSRALLERVLITSDDDDETCL
ncbi:Aste57867_5354 [Aphanomyces stellatus]|uniref:Aste57867_4835 protein n=1 Tax=Aphanomyces stellatus TaxID=120398 RepID=A0A485KCS9_9STRA|nr:hypothetical protein As57867_005341 [Aphanomyces stellatus]KAF0712435.1 hypothetical protein As57867_004822 [Aphanomyces stellatus]VFT81928.1 Aste57867_4835 [Aphanomyces stellatus]VFT82415.1 Aste57867_5354 [Aphanomyces stellatus]